MSLLLATATGGGAVNYSLIGSTGSYTVTGQNALFKVSRTLTGSAGSYVLSGQSLGFGVARRLTGSTGSYSLTGNNASFTTTRRLTGSSGDYVVSGIAATFTYVPGIGPVNYNLSGSAGSYTLTGLAASFKATRTLVGNVGSYIWAGQALGFAVSRRLVGDAGSYSVNGQNATLTYTPGAPGTINYSLVGEKGSYSITGIPCLFGYLAGITKHGGDDAPRGIYYQDQPKRKRRRLSRKLDLSIEQKYRELTEDKTVKEAAKKAVQPYKEHGRIDWVSLKEDIDAVQRLLDLYVLHLELQDEEDITILLMGV